MNNIEYCVHKILADNIPNDFIETVVWSGVATIFMKALLKINNDNSKNIWVADSFEGMPKPDAEKYKAVAGDKHYMFGEPAIPLETVKNNFENYDLYDENAKFLKGRFKDTFPVVPIQKLPLIRLDGDMYESTMDGLVNLYPKLSNGRFINDWAL